MGPTSDAVDGRWTRLVTEHRRRQTELRNVASSRPRLGFGVAAVAVLGATAASAAAVKGADNWCASEGLARGGYSSKEVGVSAWPPGIRCSFTANDETEVNLVLPFGG